LLRVKRLGMAAAAKTSTSRAMADTAHAEVYRRPAFHNYGRSSTIIPGVRKANEALRGRRFCCCHARSRPLDGLRVRSFVRSCQTWWPHVLNTSVCLYMFFFN
jgi:beta-phosphoglucomutase-like phosphatase (HAD superfamily)